MNLHVNKPVAGKSSINFGLYPKYLKIKTDVFSVITLPEYESIMKFLDGHPNVDDGWIYAGLQETLDLYGNVRKKPYSGRVFSLPKTHVLELSGAYLQEDLDFIIWCLSFFTGMRLTSTQGGFLDATPIRPWKLVDFCVAGPNEHDAIQVALNYLNERKLQPLECRRIEAIIHSLFLSQRPQNLHFEKFQYLYMAIDGCFSIMWDNRDRVQHSKKPIHANRIRWMCEEIEIFTPFWAEGEENIASVRNDNFHEAIFFGRPLGFSVFKETSIHTKKNDILLQMEALVCRLLVAILGVKDIGYINSGLSSRDYHLLKLK